MHRRPIALALVAPALLWLGGCYSYHRAASSGSEPRPVPADAWPTFDTAPLNPLLDTPAVIVHAEVDPEKLPKSVRERGEPAIQALRDKNTDDLIYADLDAHGLLRAWRPRTEKPESESVLDNRLRFFRQNAQYLTGPAALLQAETERIERDIIGGDPLEDIARFFGLASTTATPDWLLDGGVVLRIPEAVDDNPPALVIHLTSLIENKYEHAVTDRLAAHGYAVAYLDTSVWIDGPNEHEVELTSAKRSARRQEILRQTSPEHPELESRSDTFKRISQASEIARAEFPPVEDGMQVRPDTDLDRLADYIASQTDARLAEQAFAAEALVRACDGLHPSLADRPVVVMGFSAGALAAPTIAARLHDAYPDRPVLLVMIGGGGDLFDISQQSTISKGGIGLSPAAGPPPTDEQIAHLHDRYRSKSRLDPLAIAPSLRAVPALHVYATRDKVVPTAAAEAFNTAHGSVDRITHPGNHGTLFFFLPGQAGKIRSWLRSQGIE